MCIIGCKGKDWHAWSDVNKGYSTDQKTLIIRRTKVSSSDGVSKGLQITNWFMKML